MSESDIEVQHHGRRPVTRHFFNGFIRLHILYHAAKEPIYGAEITEELVRHGYRLSQGTLYPTLHLLEGLGYLKAAPEVVAGSSGSITEPRPRAQDSRGRARQSSWNWSPRSSRTRTSRFGRCGEREILGDRRRRKKDPAKEA